MTHAPAALPPAPADTSVQYRLRAELHKPRTAAEIERAARDLAAQGFGDYTIAHVLAMDVTAVRQMIGERAHA